MNLKILFNFTNILMYRIANMFHVKDLIELYNLTRNFLLHYLNSNTIISNTSIYILNFIFNFYLGKNNF